MGLIQNGYSFMSAGVQFAGLTALNGACPATHHYNFHQAGRSRNMFAGEAIADDKVSVPVGYRPPSCWIMAQKAGGLGSTGRQIVGSGATGSVNLAGGLNAESTLEGIGGIDDAAMGLIMQAIATLAGVGGTTVTANGILDAIATLTGAGGLSAPLGAIAGAMATLAGQGGVCCSTPRADGFMSADIAPSTTTAASVIAQAVWDYLASQADTAGSMGEAVLAGSGGLVPPTVDEVAAAVLAILNANNIPVNTVKIKGQTITGSGTGADPWGPS